MKLYNFGVEGSSLTKLYNVMCLWMGGDNAGITFREHRPLKISEGKNVKNWCYLRQFATLTANITETERNVKNWNST